MKENYYKIVDFPTDFKSKKKMPIDMGIMPHANISTTATES